MAKTRKGKNRKGKTRKRGGTSSSNEKYVSQLIKHNFGKTATFNNSRFTNPYQISLKTRTGTPFPRSVNNEGNNSIPISIKTRPSTPFPHSSEGRRPTPFPRSTRN